MRRPALPTRGVQAQALLAAALLSVLLLPAAPSALAHGGCTRIHVESREGRVIINSYVVAGSDFVAKLHLLIDQNGEDGAWAVAAGELSSLGYTVTYTCVP